MMQLTPGHFERRRLETLVENRTVYSLQWAELNVFETQLHAEKVELSFGSPVLASMLRGKKVMHLRENSFDFFPGESVVLPPDELMRIDFPEATNDNPTQCLALTMDGSSINKVVDYLNETAPRAEEKNEWRFTDYNFHFTNDVAVNQIIGRLIWLFTENHPSKDVFADFMLRELIIRLMQTEARHLLTENTEALQNNSRLAFVIKFIRENLHDPLNIDQLSKKACMSQTHFFRCFKNELGISPVDFINAERIKQAKNLLQNPKLSINDVCYACGFNNVSYFNKIFKRATRLTPSEFRQRYGRSGEVVLVK
ncbi:MAG: AraC family transcriptional regulator [Chitinophagales bacterium]|nr:AraC family transcriptional regulator [Chitinophagales bacterium]